MKMQLKRREHRLKAPRQSAYFYDYFRVGAVVSSVSVILALLYGRGQEHASLTSGVMAHEQLRPQEQQRYLESPAATANVGSRCATKGNRTLVLLMGDLECGETAWKSLYRHVLDVNCADLAVLAPKEQAHTNTRTNKGPSILRRAKYIWTYRNYEDWGEAWDTIDKNWRQKVVTTPQAIQNGVYGGIKGNPGTGAKYNMLQYWLRQHILQKGLLERYDRFILSTTGQYFVCDFDVEALSPHWVWLPHGGGHFMVASSYHIADSLNVIPTMLERSTLAEEQDIWEDTSTIERLLVASYDSNHVPTDGIRRVFYGCQRESEDGTKSSDPHPLARQDESVRFNLALGTCPKSGLAPKTLEFEDPSDEEEVFEGDESSEDASSSSSEDGEDTADAPDSETKQTL